ncbi:hypothetical protein [Puniceibacterium sp. IMCC21224]|uniref:hypothetical protein n=1 Tax=Puniceibacterium sp. IMCC21224 TaxID=1618204 RepID=UPI00064DD464|nr:hypothetical protein [Puniceibacterium sp. IMCC21224]KMK68563.1 hypothetical protein IMCC21224_113446 [Puniceibacterium sp. IMCC21224]
MNDLLISKGTSGEVVVERIVRERLGSFQNRIHAELFADALRKAAMPTADLLAPVQGNADETSAVCNLAKISADCADRSEAATAEISRCPASAAFAALDVPKINGYISARPEAPAPEVVKPKPTPPVPSETAKPEPALESAAKTDGRSKPVKPVSLKPAPEPLPKMTRAEEFGSVAQAVQSPTRVQSAPKASKNNGEPDLAEAFSRIRAGETVKDVADDMGFAFPSLRGKWANQKRHNSVEVSPELEACSLCDKLFKPSTSSPDKCSRCAKG